MMIKANGEYLDFNGDIEIESQVKLFEDIETVNGDYSYDIEIEDSAKNRKILGIPRADTVKIIYQAVPAEVIDDTGQSIYLGKLQVNKISNRKISATFYAGNNEWFALLSEPMSSLYMLRNYDIDLTVANIQASWLKNSGIVLPIIDTGSLLTRSFSNLKVEDFTSAFYVKTLFHEIFSAQGIKLDGDLINDWLFNNSTIQANGRNQEDVDNRSAYAENTIAQSISITVFELIPFQNDSIFPFFSGSSGNFTQPSAFSSRYDADIKMRIKVELLLKYTYNSGTFPTFGVYVNNVSIKEFTLNGPALTDNNYSISYNVLLEAGDFLTFKARGYTGTFTLYAESTLRITPIYLYKVFGKSSVPNWSQLDFVSNILRLFNVLPSYNSASKTLTLDLFNNIKNKQYVDISDQIVINEIDFSEFVSDYAKNNIFKYQESDEEDLREYNISNFISYGSGNLIINNDFIENTADIVESDFTSPITYLNGIFDTSMELIKFTELEDIEDYEVTSVSNSSGTPRFNISNADEAFIVGDLVRFTDMDSYDGEWVINAVTSSYITVNGLSYLSSDTGNATLLQHRFTTDDNVYLFVNVPNISTTYFSSKGSMLIDNTTFTSASLSYFNMLSNGRPINRIYKQSLSFGEVNNPLSYQLTLLDTYWPLFSRILNSPVSLLASGYLKRTTFDQIKTFLRPVRIETEETTNLYYVNRNTGYKGSERPCELELIKLN